VCVCVCFCLCTATPNSKYTLQDTGPYSTASTDAQDAQLHSWHAAQGLKIHNQTSARPTKPVPAPLPTDSRRPTSSLLASYIAARSLTATAPLISPAARKADLEKQRVSSPSHRACWSEPCSCLFHRNDCSSDEDWSHRRAARYAPWLQRYRFSKGKWIRLKRTPCLK
jgi:hypothetical protein